MISIYLASGCVDTGTALGDPGVSKVFDAAVDFSDPRGESTYKYKIASNAIMPNAEPTATSVGEIGCFWTNATGWLGTAANEGSGGGGGATGRTTSRGGGGGRTGAGGGTGETGGASSTTAAVFTRQFGQSLSDGGTSEPHFGQIHVNIAS